jgi:predicted nucleic acid-binding protein
MRRLLDSVVLIDHLRGDRRATDLMVRLRSEDDELWSVTVVRTEVLGGRRPGEERATMLLLGALHWLEVDRDLADRAAALMRRYRRSHAGIGITDYLLAASAEVLGAELVTLNVRHFPMFPDLEPAYR